MTGKTAELPRVTGALASRRRPTASGLARGSAIALIAGLTGWLAFESGGFFAKSTAIAAIALVVAILLFVMLAARPLAYVSVFGVVGIGALVLLTAWTLVSGAWSEAPTRTLHDYQRTLLYSLTFGLFACLGGSAGNARWLLRSLALALGAATVVGLAARLDPALGEALSARVDERLSWPLGYWNALGLAGALSAIVCLHLSSDLKEARATRVVAAAAVPALATAVFLSLSRGAILAGALGAAALLLLARGRGTPSALVAVVPCAVYAMLEAYGATALTDADAGAGATARAGAAVADAVLFATAGAAALRALGLALDARLQRARLWRPLSPTRSALLVLVAVVAFVGTGAALGLQEPLERQYDAFLETKPQEVEQERDRLAQASANGRIEHWDVGLAAWREAPAIGHGAGTYAREWARLRPITLSVQDAHSLYVETLAELGIVGFGLLAVALLAPLSAMVIRRREDRALWSAALAIYLAWLSRAGIDWDWEMPALTLPVFALAGAACGRATARVDEAQGQRRTTLRLVAGLGVLLLLITPIRVAVSQHHLEEAVTAFGEGRCATTVTRALAAAEVLGTHPAPFELLGFCDVRAGRSQLGVRMLEAAVRREPGSWELHYGLALVRGAAGRDPRPALRRARDLNPRELRITVALERLASDNPAQWRRVARRLPLIVPPADRPENEKGRPRKGAPSA